MKNLGIVGHSRTMQITQQLLHQHYPHIRITEIPMNDADTDAIVSTLRTLEPSLDGILFTGKIPYDLINASMVSRKPWVYIRHDIARLMGGLMEAAVMRQYDIASISVDSYSEEEIYDVYRSIRLPMEALNIHIAPGTIYHPQYVEEIKSFHRRAFTEGNVSVCITGLSEVYNYLSSQNIPCIVLDPTRQNIDDALRFIESKQLSQNSQSRHIVALSIERDLPNDHALIKENEYQLALETMKISEEIYLFSQRIQAAIVEKEMGKYLLFTTRYLLELETEELQKLNIITRQRVHRFGTLSIGIGYGETAREAKYNANLGLLKSKKNGGNQAYKVENNHYVGPITPGNIPAQDDYSIDGPYQTIATQTGISINSILKLQTIIDQQQSDTFTPNELSALYGITARSMNRILEKLLDTDYATIVGCNMRSSSGRPSRIIRLQLKRDKMNSSPS